jgi:hypothetical protein
MTSVHTISAIKYVWKIELFPGYTLLMDKKPRLWTRSGVWIWFGLRGQNITEGEK